MGCLLTNLGSHQSLTLLLEGKLFLAPIKPDVQVSFH
jgi:hypothetical protein